ncbi:hypothetical protein B0H10DRAFT_2193256 [Mycena sp. CBHHK59/15]|nr:hypothetical protein B0H10DRAFT_2193256 [Mycena sp. CBHHK59/15]
MPVHMHQQKPRQMPWPSERKFNQTNSHILIHQTPQQNHKRSISSSTLTQSALTAFRKNDMLYSDSEAAALQRPALHAIVSSGFPLNVFEDPEMLILFGMLRTTAPAIMLTGKVVGGWLLTSVAAEVEDKVAKALKIGMLGCRMTDAWKRQRRDAVNALCLNVDFKSYLIELVEVTALNKDGPSLCNLFADMIDRMEEKYGCVIIYFTTNTDGGSKKGRILLGKKQLWLILPSCWAHQFQLILGGYFKVNDMAAGIAEEATALITWINNHSKIRKILNDAQAIISKDRNAGRIIILACLVTNLTHWTTHFVMFMWLFIFRSALQLAVLQKCSAIIVAEVGAVMSTEGDCLKEDTEKFCALIEDASFWNGLETGVGTGGDTMSTMVTVTVANLGDHHTVKHNGCCGGPE